MSTIIETKDLTKRYRDVTALDRVNLSLAAGRVYGLFGRNGAGKSTLMSILTAQNFPTSGAARIMGQNPYENARVLRHMCFVRESQKYPDDATAAQAMAMARIMFPNWRQDVAQQMAKQFELPLKRRVKKMSRGQQSAVGVTIGLAAGADIVFFDEPYLGLDATARQLFYAALGELLGERPVTVVLSSHLIDEIAGLVEHVIALDKGKVMLDQSAESLAGAALRVVGKTDAVAAAVKGRQVLATESLGPVTAATVAGPVPDAERAAWRGAGLDLEPVSLQQLIVQAGLSNAGATPAVPDDARELEGTRK